MKTSIAALVVFGALATLGTVPAAGQAQWGERPVQGGVEFRLTNAEGAAIVLRCSDQGVDAGFVLAEPIAEVSGAMVTGLLSDRYPGWTTMPRKSHRFPVVRIDERSVQVARGRGLDFTWAMLAAASSIHVRTAGQRASFDVPGIDSILPQCRGAEELGFAPRHPNGEIEIATRMRMLWVPVPVGQAVPE